MLRALPRSLLAHMAKFLGLALCAAAVFQQCAAQIDPAHAKNQTVYHLNPVTAGAVPINMDTGDARGDLYFYLGQFLLPLECANVSSQSRSHFDCDNPERVDPDLVVTRVDMQIDNRNTQYSACNLCNGTDPFTRKPCKLGSYVCDCFNYENKSVTCDATRVGTESIADKFTPHVTNKQCAAALEEKCGSVKKDARLCGLCEIFHMKGLKKANCGTEDFFGYCPSQWEKCSNTSKEWTCWAENIPRKTGGNWFSTLKDGLCNKSSPEGSCGWKVLSTKTVKNKCLKEKLMTHAEKASPDCFGSCGPRDTNSSCWIGCFFDTMLGPQARHSDTVALGGLPVAEIEKTWESAFLPEEQGGCPVEDVPDTWDVPPMGTVVV